MTTNDVNPGDNTAVVAPRPSIHRPLWGKNQVYKVSVYMSSSAGYSPVVAPDFFKTSPVWTSERLFFNFDPSNSASATLPLRSIDIPVGEEDSGEIWAHVFAHHADHSPNPQVASFDSHKVAHTAVCVSPNSSAVLDEVRVRLVVDDNPYPSIGLPETIHSQLVIDELSGNYAPVLYIDTWGVRHALVDDVKSIGVPFHFDSMGPWAWQMRSHVDVAGDDVKAMIMDTHPVLLLV